MRKLILNTLITTIFIMNINVAKAQESIPNNTNSTVNEKYKNFIDRATNKGKEILINQGKQTAKEVAKKAVVPGAIAGAVIAKKVWNNKGKVIGLGILSAVGFAITRDKFLHLIYTPEEQETKDFIQNLVEYKPKRALAFVKFIDYNINKTNDIEYKNDLQYFKDYYHLDENEDLIYQKIIDSPEYKQYINVVTAQSLILERNFNKKHPKYCDVFDYNGLITIDKYLEIIKKINISYGNLNTEYSVSRYGDFNNSGNSMNADHVPSYRAIEVFLDNKGLFTKDTIGRNKNTILVNNLTAINISEKIHNIASRTFKGRNNKKTYIPDANNLLKATIRDIAFISTYLDIVDKVNPTNYLLASYTLINRNFYLCLYKK